MSTAPPKVRELRQSKAAFRKSGRSVQAQGLQLNRADSSGHAPDYFSRDEVSLKQRLDSIWLTVLAESRESCKALAMAGGGRSYVDLLTCLQMAGWAAPSSPDAAQGREQESE